MEVHDWEQDLQVAKDLITELKQTVPQEIKHCRYSTTAKIPFKLDSITGVFVYRIIELSETSFALIENKKYLPAAILIRSTMETAGLLHYAYLKVRAVIEKGTVGNVDRHLMRLLLGCKEKEDIVKPVNVLDGIRSVDKWLNKVNLEHDNERTKNVFMEF